jgi:hypothetical protein
MARGDFAMHGMMPPDQGLRAALPFGGEVELGLIDNLELFTVESAPEFGLDLARGLATVKPGRVVVSLQGTELGLGLTARRAAVYPGQDRREGDGNAKQEDGGCCLWRSGKCRCHGKRNRHRHPIEMLFARCQNRHEKLPRYARRAPNVGW